jgi:hypothetical protein
MSIRAEVRRERREKIKLDVRKLRAPDWPQLGVRFAFGACIAVVAGLAGLRWGHRVGGVLLAFPAIIPAALTLLERSDGVKKTDADALGAILGAVAMLLFAVAVALLGGRLGIAAVLIAAALWALAAAVLFRGARAASVRVGRQG